MKSLLIGLLIGLSGMVMAQIIVPVSRTEPTQRQLWRDDLRTIKTNMIANIDEVQAIDTTLTTAVGQQDQIKVLKRELIDIAKELQALRKVVAEQTKGD